MAKNTKVRNNVIKEVRLLLGDGMVDIELDPDHYDLAVDVALSKIRQRSENAVEEDFYSIELKKDVDEYTLPAEITEVKQIWHRSFGHGISGGVDMDPFELAYANSYFFSTFDRSQSGYFSEIRMSIVIHLLYCFCSKYVCAFE